MKKINNVCHAMTKSRRLSSVMASHIASFFPGGLFFDDGPINIPPNDGWTLIRNNIWRPVRHFLEGYKWLK